MTGRGRRPSCTRTLGFDSPDLTLTKEGSLPWAGQRCDEGEERGVADLGNARKLMQAGERAAEHDAKVALVLNRKLNIGATDAQAVGGRRAAGAGRLAQRRGGASREAEVGQPRRQIVSRNSGGRRLRSRRRTLGGQLADGEVDGSRALDQRTTLFTRSSFKIAVVVARRTRLLACTWDGTIDQRCSWDGFYVNM